MALSTEEAKTGGSFAAAGLFLAAFAAYGTGAMPSLYGGDSGELITSALALGVSHAPGYPLHALMGKLFSNVLPWGGPAYRVNLFSAFLSAATGVVLFSALRDLLKNAVAGAAGALVYAALPIVWDQAQGTEVFALNNLLAALLILFFVRAFPSDGRLRPRWLAGGGFLYGLGLANHQTLVFLAPGFVWAAGRFFWERGAGAAENLKRAARSATDWLPAATAFFLLGLSVYLYLPLRAARHPPVNFGDPHTLRRFVDVLTRKEFGRLELHPAALPFHTAGTVAAQLKSFFRQNVAAGGGFVLALGLLGFLLSSRRPDPAADVRRATSSVSRGAWLLFWILPGPFFYVFSNLSPFNTLAQWRMERFLLLPMLFLAAGAALLTERLLSKRRTGLAIVLLGAVCVEQVFFRPHPWFRWNLGFRDFGRNLCSSLEPRSLLLIDRVMFDEPTSCLMNRLLVERQRPDVRPIYRPGTLFELFYGEDILEIHRDRRYHRQQEREDALWRTLDRPLSVMAFVRDNLPPGDFVLNGLLFQEKKTGRPSDFYIWRGRGPHSPDDYPSRLIRVHYPYLAAKAGFEENDVAGAERYSAESLYVGRDMEWLFSNIGSLWSRWEPVAPELKVRAMRESGRAFSRAVGTDPFFPQGQFGAGYVELQRKNYAGAVDAFAAAARLRPDWPEAHYMLGLAYNFKGLRAEARRAWERFLALDPRSALASDVRRELSGS
ncbi:MAG TPA: DUF2723 domain-containing protein [Elusimicrobiota bacterium]|nr:DUF2723 domain-containing protein [Elusimicrobiota bacterium]